MSEVSPRGEQVLDSLEEIFLKEGFRRVTIGELAARLRCSRRMLYSLADSKEDLFLRVLDRFLRRVRRLGDEAARSHSDLPERIHAYLEPGITETRIAGAAFSADVAMFPPARRLLEDHQRERMARLRDLVQEGVDRSIFRGVNPTLVAEVMTVAVGRLKEPDFLAESNLSMSEAFAEMSHLIRHGLLHPERPEEEPGAEEAPGSGEAPERRAAEARSAAGPGAPSAASSRGRARADEGAR